jgi:two-component system, LytTR family, response regulator
VNLRVLIADDEPLSRERLKGSLTKVPEIEVVAECTNGLEALSAIRQKTPDLAFLDVRMPELDAFGVLERLKEERLPAIILVTGHGHFALRAFEIHAVDYLLKPFDDERLQLALRRARDRLHPGAPELNRSSASVVTPAGERGAKRLERVVVESSGRLIPIRTIDIDWISAADNYVELHMGTKSYLLRTTITELAKRLPDRFARIGRSVLVNMDRIKEFQAKSHGDYSLVLQTGVTLQGSRNYRDCLAGLFGAI